MRDYKTRLEALEQQSSNTIPPSVRREVEAIVKRYEDEYRAEAENVNENECFLLQHISAAA